MRWFVIAIFAALIGAAGWYVARLEPVQQFLEVPVPSSVSDGEDQEVSESVLNLGSDLEEVLPDEPETAPSANLEPVTTPSELEGEASLAQYKAWIGEARAQHPYPDSEQRMFDVMMCESGGNADIVNPAGPYTGLFQYVAGTWRGEWNTYRDSDVTDARAQIFATALAWNLGMQSHWGCYTRTHE